MLGAFVIRPIPLHHRYQNSANSAPLIHGGTIKGAAEDASDVACQGDCDGCVLENFEGAFEGAVEGIIIGGVLRGAVGGIPRILCHGIVKCQIIGIANHVKVVTIGNVVSAVIRFIS